MRWMRKWPKQAGWFWFRDKAGTSVVKIEKHPTLGLRFADLFRIPGELRHWRGEWCGPLREPTERRR